MNETQVEALVFDNVRPARLTLDDLLGGGIGVWLFDATEEGAPADPDLKERVISTDACACRKAILQAMHGAE
jgi:hypothetical protein